MEYFTIEPFGFAAEDARFALTMTVIARAAGARTAMPSDFSMGAIRPAPTEDDEEGGITAASLAAALGTKLPPRRSTPADEDE